MMIRDPEMRPTAQGALQYWYRLRDGLNITMASWGLRKPDEFVGERVINTVAAARDNIMYLSHGDVSRAPLWPDTGYILHRRGKHGPIHDISEPSCHRMYMSIDKKSVEISGFIASKMWSLMIHMAPCLRRAEACFVRQSL
jgi:hypothetical protein